MPYLTTEENIAKVSTIPTVSVEFNHVPMSAWKAWLKKWERQIEVSLASFFVLTCVIGTYLNLMPIFIGGLILILGIFAASLLQIRASCLKRTVTIGLNQHGIRLDLRSKEAVILPWHSLMFADLILDGNGQAGKISLVFDDKQISSDTYKKLWMKPNACNGQELTLDLDAVAKRDHLKVMSMLNRLVPSASVGQNIARFASPQHNPRFTELWNESLQMSSRRISVSQLQPGDWLNDCRFEVVGRLGAGGQGTAYEAIDHYPPSENADRVVLKEFVLPVHGDPSAAASALNMVQQEADIIRSLNSEYAVRYYDLFVEDSRAYLVREFVDGGSLKEIVDINGPLVLDSVYSIAISMCDILQHLHSQNPPIIHRDFTPDNLLLNRDKKLKLIDFDIARHEDQCKTNQVVGKPNYLAPEQFRGCATTQSDIYSLGATLFFISTGAQPKPISASHPRSLVPALHERFDEIVAKATAVDCLKRYETLDALRQDLLEASGGYHRD